MAANIRLVQFRTIAGDGNVTVVGIDELAQELGWGFFGNHVAGSGYISPPNTTDASKYPTRAGAASWEVWLAAEVTGTAFQLVTDLHFICEAYNQAGLGTFANATNGHRIPAGTAILNLSGLYMHSVQGPIETETDPDPTLFVPVAAPSVGLPLDVEGDGWLLFGEAQGSDPVFPEDATDADPPTALNLTPVNVFLPQVGNDPYGRGILVTDQEPRFSNIAVANLCLATDAAGDAVYNPVEMMLVWNES